MVRMMLIVLLFSTLLPSIAAAQLRLALLIGNQGYGEKVGALKNPHNDVRAVGRALEAVSFKTMVVREAGRRQVLSAVSSYAAELAKGGAGTVGFLYYSGHGVSRPEDRANYLIPVDLRDIDSPDFWFDAVKLDDILGVLEQTAPLAAHFIVFDACRNELKVPGKSVVKGFEPVAERSGMFIAFATTLGTAASDRGEASGPYAGVLATELVKPGQDHLQLFQNVKEGVFSTTGRRQVPWERNGLLRRVYFAGQQTALLAPSPQSEAAQAWAAIKDAPTFEAVRSYIGRYPDSPFVDIARARLDDLRRTLALSAARDATALQGGRVLRYYGSPTEASCRADCGRDNVCVAYTWVKPGGYQPGDQPACYLMATVGTPSSHKCCITGMRGPFSGP